MGARACEPGVGDACRGGRVAATAGVCWAKICAQHSGVVLLDGVWACWGCRRCGDGLVCEGVLWAQIGCTPRPKADSGSQLFIAAQRLALRLSILSL
jgi:hypothetical protein